MKEIANPKIIFIYSFIIFIYVYNMCKLSYHNLIYNKYLKGYYDYYIRIF